MKHAIYLKEKFFWWVEITNRFAQLWIILNTLFFSASAITGSISIAAIADLLCIRIGITASAIELKICTITVGIKRIS